MSTVLMPIRLLCRRNPLIGEFPSCPLVHIIRTHCCSGTILICSGASGAPGLNQVLMLATDTGPTKGGLLKDKLVMNIIK